MVRVGCTYIEMATNNTSSPITITYNLNGYIEKTFGTRASTPVLFKMLKRVPDPIILIEEKEKHRHRFQKSTLILITIT
ncbi:AAA ATPase [Chryseobacterium sp. StRB126]|nr:AAA ATPase [Chryseobacterium sp. StRB126]